jgi:pimeloyl-ACP methyl ester carboxylesterase
MSTHCREFTLTTSEGKTISGAIDRTYTSAKPLVVICHGCGCHKESLLYRYLSGLLTANGFNALRFNFSHSGVNSEGSYVATDLCETNTLATENDDLKRLLEALSKRTLPECEHIDTSRVFLLGHSRGTVSAFRQASANSNVLGVVSFAGIATSKLSRLQPLEQVQWLLTGYRTRVEHGKTYRCAGPSALREDLVESQLLELAVRQCRKPVLLFHGSSDCSVPLRDAYLLRAWSEHSYLVIVRGADHYFTTFVPNCLSVEGRLLVGFLRLHSQGA